MIFLVRCSLFFNLTFINKTLFEFVVCAKMMLWIAVTRLILTAFSICIGSKFKKWFFCSIHNIQTSIVIWILLLFEMFSAILGNVFTSGFHVTKVVHHFWEAPVCLFCFDGPATSGVISGQILTCNNMHSWQLYRLPTRGWGERSVG